MNITEKPPLEEVYLAHYGVKGMKWGQRKAAVAQAIKDRKPDPETIARAKGIAVAGSVAVGSILYATGTLRPTAAFVGSRTARGAGWLGSKALDGAITVIGTPIEFLTGGKLTGTVANKLLPDV